MVIMFYFIYYQILLLPQIKRSVIIRSKHGIRKLSCKLLNDKLQTLTKSKYFVDYLLPDQFFSLTSNKIEFHAIRETSFRKKTNLMFVRPQTIALKHLLGKIVINL